MLAPPSCAVQEGLGERVKHATEEAAHRVGDVVHRVEHVAEEAAHRVRDSVHRAEHVAEHAVHKVHACCSRSCRHNGHCTCLCGSHTLLTCIAQQPP